MKTNIIDDYELKTLSLDKEIGKKEFVLNHKKGILRGVKTLKVATNFLPFVLASGLTLFCLSKENVSPFGPHIVKEYSNVKTSTFTNGDYLEQSSFDENYRNEIIFHKPWTINKAGFYEREKIVFDARNINDDNMSQYLNYSIEELESLQIIGRSKIVKTEILPEDEKFFEPQVEVVIGGIDEKVSRNTNTFNLFVPELFIYILGLTIFGTTSYNIFFRRPEEYLTKKEEEIKNLDEDEIKKLRRRINIRKNNLALLNEGDE